MADNTLLLPGAGGDTLATDDIGGIKFPRNKLIHGADGVNAGDVSVNNGLPIQIVPAISGGYSSKSFATAGSDNATVLKNAPGQLYGVHVFNNADYTIYVKLYNKATAPNPAADNALLLRRVGVPAGVPRDVIYLAGIPFSTGIGYVVVKGISDTDDTGVLANDGLVDLEYL